MARLYHGTHTGILGRILREGLVPRGQRQSIWEQAPSKPEFVYLTVAYPLYFALSATAAERERRRAQHKKYRHIQPVVLEIEADALPEEQFYPDEDALTYAFMTGKRAGMSLPEAHLEVHEDVFSLARAVDLEPYQALWPLSLLVLGNCAYRGTIPPEALTRYAAWDMSRMPQLTYLALEPTISIANYKFLGAHYRSLVAFLMEGTPIVPETTFPDTEEFVEAHARLQQMHTVLTQEREGGVRVVQLNDLPSSPSLWENVWGD